MARKNKRQKKKDESLIVDDYNQGFSWRVFWDEQVIGRIKKIHDFLQEHGILYFFLSVFQYKSRLILKLVLIAFGILVGIVPRSVHLLNETKYRNAQSELAQASSETAGKISVEPMASSQYKKQHVLVFNIDGDTADNVPSTTSGYNVKLSVNRGVSDAGHVKYKYEILPVSTNSRLLIIYVDQTKQNDFTGIFNLSVNIKGKAKMLNPIEIVLSNVQKTNKLFDGKSVGLASLSTKLIQTVNDSDSQDATIAKAKSDLKNKLEVYETNEQRLNSIHMTAKPTYKELKTFVDQYSVLKNVSDKSTISVVDKDKNEVDAKNLNQTQSNDDLQNVANGDSDSADSEYTIPNITASITYKGKTLKAQSDSGVTSSDDDSDGSDAGNAQGELSTLSGYLGNVIDALNALNTARITRYNELSNIETVLSKKIDVEHMGKTYTVHG